MESSARFPEMDLLEMWENNQNKNTQRSTKNWVKVFDLWRAERREVRKLEEIPEHELDDFLWMLYTCLSTAYGLVQFWLSSQFFSCNYFQIGQHVVL